LYLPQLSPYAFKIGPIGVHWYGIFMVIAMVLGTWYLIREAQKYGYDPDYLANVALWAVLGGVVGARLVFVLANEPQWITQDPMQALRIWQGGLSIHGALGGGILTMMWVLKKDKKLFGRMLDWTVPGIAIGICLVRIGNIFNHEVLGRMTELGFGRWPEQLIGSAIGLGLLIRYFVVARRDPKPYLGYQFWSFVFWYQVFRGFVGETTRDNPLYLIHYINPYWGIGFTTLTQLFTLPILAFSWYMMRRSKQNALMASDEDTGTATPGEPVSTP
jgi:phosphatidylglycerol:prolipoprotein diacylglycerol transferase